MLLLREMLCFDPLQIVYCVNYRNAHGYAANEARFFTVVVTWGISFVE